MPSIMGYRRGGFITGRIFRRRAGLGKILEPAAGIGNFFSVMPKEMFENSTLSMVEIDTVSSMIAQKLHPNAAIYNMPFQESDFLHDSYDLIISNVPFGDYKVFDRDLGGEE